MGRGLSTGAQATFEADRKAFTALCRPLKANDGDERTVIAVQIENEPGILGSDRVCVPPAFRRMI
jgi:hypothetical protein